MKTTQLTSSPREFPTLPTIREVSPRQKISSRQDQERWPTTTSAPSLEEQLPSTTKPGVPVQPWTTRSEHFHCRMGWSHLSVKFIHSPGVEEEVQQLHHQQQRSWIFASARLLLWSRVKFHHSGASLRVFPTLLLLQHGHDTPLEPGNLMKYFPTLFPTNIISTVLATSEQQVRSCLETHHPPPSTTLHFQGTPALVVYQTISSTLILVKQLIHHQQDQRLTELSHWERQDTFLPVITILQQLNTRRLIYDKYYQRCPRTPSFEDLSVIVAENPGQFIRVNLEHYDKSRTLW